jgi:hypothetical protein
MSITAARAPVDAQIFLYPLCALEWEAVTCGQRDLLAYSFDIDQEIVKRFDSDGKSTRIRLGMQQMLEDLIASRRIAAQRAVGPVSSEMVVVHVVIQCDHHTRKRAIQVAADIVRYFRSPHAELGICAIDHNALPVC